MLHKEDTIAIGLLRAILEQPGTSNIIYLDPILPLLTEHLDSEAVAVRKEIRAILQRFNHIFGIKIVTHYSESLSLCLNSKNHEKKWFFHWEMLLLIEHWLKEADKELAYPPSLNKLI